MGRPIPDRPRVLVVQTAFLGDVVLATSLLGAVRARFPEGFVAFMGTPAGTGDERAVARRRVDLHEPGEVLVQHEQSAARERDVHRILRLRAAPGQGVRDDGAISAREVDGNDRVAPGVRDVGSLRQRQDEII